MGVLPTAGLDHATFFQVVPKYGTFSPGISRIQLIRRLEQR